MTAVATPAAKNRRTPIRDLTRSASRPTPHGVSFPHRSGNTLAKTAGPRALYAIVLALLLAIAMLALRSRVELESRLPANL
jgi:hypothetical protein